MSTDSQLQSVTTTRRRGRPPKSADAMLARINIRVPKAVMDGLVAERDARANTDGADTAHVIRELLVEALTHRGRL